MARRTCAMVALLALCSRWSHFAAAQMESPLKGQGVPSLNTTQVFLSIRLERLLEVDDYKFRHENVATYWLSWADPGAEAVVRSRTAATLGGTAGCRRPCSNRVADVRCCDAIFLPSLYFTNADAFPEDREIGYSIDTTANGAVVWESTVHGFFYQPMSLRNYPFDAYQLEVQLTLTDTSRSVAGHPGLQLVPSAVSLEGLHFARTTSDLTNGFNVGWRAEFQLYRFNRSAWYQGRTLLPPHAADVASFIALNTSTSGLLDDTAQTAVLHFHAARSFWSNNLNTIYPVLAVAVMSVTVFWVPEDELAARLELCVALFLTLIAIQFVVSDRAVSRNDYMTPPQTLILLTGGYILAIACESVICYYVYKWNAFKQRRRDMWRAARERSMQRRTAKTTAAAAAAAAGGSNAEEDEVVKPFGSLSMVKSEATADDSQLCEDAAPVEAAGKKFSGCLRCQARKKEQLPPPSDDYYAFVAWMLNKVCFVFALLSYTVATVLIHQVGSGEIFHAKDALLTHAELSSCVLPGVLPDLAGACPSAPPASSSV